MKLEISKYKGYKGFHDLRNYDLTKTEFRQYWKIQEWLSHINIRVKYFKRWHPKQYQDAQEVSARYQIFLTDKEQQGKQMELEL